MRRVKTSAEREAQQERNQHRYERVYGEVEDEMRAEWLAEFGDDPEFPFVPRSDCIHAVTVARIARLYDGEDA